MNLVDIGQIKLESVLDLIQAAETVLGEVKKLGPITT